MIFALDLEGVLAPGGTASEVSVPGYTLAGKTGTAQVAENGTYSKTKYVASFIGFAPAQDPRLLVAVIVEQPQGEIYGGSVAAPASESVTTTPSSPSGSGDPPKALTASRSDGSSPRGARRSTTERSLCSPVVSAAAGLGEKRASGRGPSEASR